MSDVERIIDPLRMILARLGSKASVRRCHDELLAEGHEVSRATVGRALKTIKDEGVAKFVERTAASTAKALRVVAQTPKPQDPAVQAELKQRVVNALDAVDVMMVDMSGAVSAALQSLKMDKASEVAAIAGAVSQLIIASTEARKAQHEIQAGIDAMEGRKDALGLRHVGGPPVETAISQAFRTVEGGKA